MANFERNLIYKIYQEDDTFVGVLDDVVSDLSIQRQINGGDSEFSFVLDRKMDDFDEDTSIKFNNRVKIYLKDSYNTAGTKLVANGYIVTYSPYLKGKQEGVEVTCLSAVSKLSNDFYRTGTAAAASDLGVELTSQRVDQMMQAIINHYRSTESNTMITNDFTEVDATTDNSGTPFSFDHRFFNMKHLDALREVSKFLPRNKSGGYWFYWRINTDGDLVVKNISATADHSFIISSHITEITGEKTIQGMVNRVYFWNEKGTVDPDYLKLTSDDLTSQGDHDIIADYMTDSKITNPNAASLLADSKVYDKKDPKVRIKLTLNGNYDLASIEPGQTCQILNAKENPYKIGSDGVLVIQSVQYEVDSVVLELSEAADNFEDIVENERQRLDKEMTWYGYITQALTAAQLGPANRSWSTDIAFSATSGADAYRQVDWTAGIVYLPTSSGSDAGKRVIDSGNTGLMSAATDYYIYLDEETINTSASNVVTGTGVIKEGGDVLTDSGKSWSNDQYKGYIVTIGGQTKIIRSNTATVLSIEDRWTISDQSSAYAIKKMTFDVTSDKTIISDLTKVIFSNVRANTDTNSEVLIATSQGASSTTNYNYDGATNIAKRSIIADRIVANAITANEINTGAINIGDWAGDLSDISDGGGFEKSTANQNTGGTRGYNGLSASYKITKGFVESDLDAIGLPANGIRIDSSGIYGRKSSVTTFYINSSGDAYFKGTIGASVISGGTITGSLIKTSNTGTRVELNEDDNALYVYYNGSKEFELLGNYMNIYYAGDLAGQISGGAANILVIAANNDAAIFFARTAGNVGNFSPAPSMTLDLGNSSYNYDDIYFDTWKKGATTYLDAGTTLDCFVDFLPSATDSKDLGSPSYNWNALNVKNIITSSLVQIDQDIWQASTYSLLVSNNSAGANSGKVLAEFYDEYSEATEIEKVSSSYLLISETEAKVIILKNLKEEALGKINAVRKDTGRFICSTEEERTLKLQKYEDKILVERDWTDSVNFDYERERYSKLDKGTVLAFSDDGVIPTQSKGQTNVMGVVSTLPCRTSYVENRGIRVTKSGHTFAKVKGQCQSGDLLWTSNEEGCLEKANNPLVGQFVGRARETKTSEKVEVVPVDLTL